MRAISRISNDEIEITLLPDDVLDKSVLDEISKVDVGSLTIPIRRTSDGVVLRKLRKDK